MPWATIVGMLLFAPTVGFTNRAFHRAGHAICIHDDPPIGVARGPANGLNQRRFRPQKALLICIEDRNQTALRDIETLAQKVDAKQDIKGAQPQIPQYLNALNRIDIAVHVAHPNALLMQIFGEIFSHAFRQCCGQNPLSHRCDFAYLIEKIIHLRFHGTNFHRWVKQARGTNHLLCENAARLVKLPFGWGGGDKNRLRPHRIPFFELERSVIHTGRQSEPVFGKCEFAAVVALIHRANLRHANMAFICENNGIVWMNSNSVGGGSPGARPVR